MSTRLRHGKIAAALSLGLALVASPALADGIADANQGREALLAGARDEAIRLFGRALASGLDVRSRATTLNLRGAAYLEKGQAETALKDLDESLRLVESADARFTRAKIQIARLKFEEAAADLSRALDLGSRTADVHALRGDALLYAGRRDEALKDLDEAIRLAPAMGFAYRTRGHLLLDQGQDDRAIADETRAIALDPKDIEARWLRAWAYRYRKNDPARAIADYGEALKLDPTDSSARAGRAEAYEALGRPAEAMADYDAWIGQNPRGPFGYQARGRLKLALGKPAEAAADLVQAVNLKPADPSTVLWLHLARAKAGTDDAAEFSANAAKAPRAAWPGPLLDYLTGRGDAATVLARAGEGDGKTAAARLCEAQLFLGQDDLAKGRRTAGLDRLKTAARTCDGASREAQLALAELQKDGAPTARPAVAAASPAPPRAVAAAKPKPKPQVATSDDVLLRGSLR